MCDFLEDKYLREQVQSIEEIGKMITNLKRVGKGLGEYAFFFTLLKGNML